MCNLVLFPYYFFYFKIYYYFHVFLFQRPIAGSGDFPVAGLCLCCRAGTVVVHIRLPQKGFILGEKVAFFVEVVNSSSRKMCNSYVALIQVCVPLCRF